MKVAIVGYGVEGKALLNYFKKHKAEYQYDITVCDEKQPAQEPTGCHFRSGPDYLENLDTFDLIFRSPGIPLLKKEFKPVRHKVTSLTRFFFEHCPCLIIGITGTKGKSTTATLLYEMLKEAGRDVFLGGNIGRAALEFLDELGKKSLVVLELSSFQLQDLEKSPQLALVLGIMPDHLDHHQDFEEYVNAKKNIVAFQGENDTVILDADNKTSAGFARHTAAGVLRFSTAVKSDADGVLKVASLVVKHGKTATIFGEKGAVGLKGDHNIKNLLAAALAASNLNVPVEVIAKVAREFKGLPHRLELVREYNGVHFYNDSASTNPDTAIAALQVFDKPLILIAGGAEKNADFKTLGEAIANRLNVKTVVIMGETKHKIERAIEEACAKREKEIAAQTARTGRPVRRRDLPLEIISAESYQEAFMVSRLLAQPGDTVLLSPACASFDMFANYKERGEIFRNFVMSL